MYQQRTQWSRRRYLRDLGAGVVALPTALSDLASGIQPSPTQEADGELLARLRKLQLSHPRLHFDRAGRKVLRDRARTTHRRYAKLLFEWVSKHGEWTPPFPSAKRAFSLTGKGDEVLLEQCGTFLTNAALAFVLSEQQRHLKVARRWTLEMCRLERGKYGLGSYAAGLARAYDWLYESWTDDERTHIQACLAKYMRQLYLNSVPGSGKTDWWADYHLHHDFWIPVGGMGEAALALIGEVDDASLCAAHVKNSFDTCLSLLGDDGYWHEGAAGWCYAMAPLLAFYSAWQSVLGENLHDVPWLKGAALFRLYHWLPDNTYIYLNDSWRSGRYGTAGSASCHLLRRLASLFGDGAAQWLAERDEQFDLRPGPKGVFQAPYRWTEIRADRREYPSASAETMAWNMLWYDAAVEPTHPRDLPRCRHFPNGGLAILRSSWDADAAVVSLACGPLGGYRHAKAVRAGKSNLMTVDHAHSDHNSLTLFVRGQYFVIPAGYGRRSSRYQNTVAVNGANYRIDPTLDVRLETVVEEPDFSYCMGDATAAFELGLGVRLYRRSLVMLSGCLILYDDLRLAQAGYWRQFQWQLHSDPRVHEVNVKGSTAQWQLRGGAATPHADQSQPRLSLFVLEPQKFAWEQAVLKSQTGVGMLESLRLEQPDWRQPRMQVLAVFTWEDRPATPKLLRTQQCLGVCWPDGTKRPGVLFTERPVEAFDTKKSLPDDVGDRELLVFGHQPNRKTKYRRVRR